MLFRITVRYVSAGAHRYHIDDVEADTLAEAMSQSAARMPADVGASADLVEVRRQADPDRREYTPG